MIKSFMIKSFPNVRRFYGTTRTLLTQKSGDVQIQQDKKNIIAAIDVPFTLNRAGLVPIAACLQIPEDANSAIQKSKLLQVTSTDVKESGVILVAKAQELKIFPEYYSHVKVNSRLSVHCSIRDVGQKSLNVQYHIYDKTNTMLLWRVIRSLVACDFKMKPVHIPEKFFGPLTSLAMHQDRFFCPEPFVQRPDNVFTTHVVPRPSDLDLLFHVNQSNYVTFMVDAAVSAAQQGVYKLLKQDLAFGSIDQILFNYHKELLSDDNVKIETWQDEEHPLKICFQMSTHSKLAFQGSILLREPLLQLSDEIKKKLPRAREL